jgi:hypothetical protein
MAISEQLVISARLDLSGVASDVGKLRSQLESANKISATSLDVEAKKSAFLDARIAKEQAAIEKINSLKEQQALKEQARLDAQIAKQESAAQRDATRKEQAAAREQARFDSQIAKQEASSAKILAQLEKQDAAAKTRLTQGNQNGNSAEQKDAIRVAKLYEEGIRLKQQLAQIKGAFFSDEDRAKAEAFALSINKINVDKINKDFGQTNTGTRNFVGNLADASIQLGFFAEKLNVLKGNAQTAFLELDTARKKLSTISNDANGLIVALRGVAETNKFQATTAQLASAAYEVQSAGFTKNADTAKILDAALKGSVGGFSDVTTVSKATISVLNAYGQSADKAASIVDKFTAVQQSGLITVDQYASQISKVAPIAASAGVSLDQLNGFIATATASGVPVEATFSGLRQALASTIKPTKQASDEAARLGIEFNSVALKTKGLNGILTDIKNSGKATGETFTTLFGSIEAVAAIQPAINDLGKLEANIKASANSAELSGKNFEKTASTLKGFANEAEDALAILGGKINETATVFNPVVAGTRSIVTAFRQLPPEVQSVIAVVVGLGATFVGLSAGFTGLLAATTPALGAFAGLAKSLAAVGTSSVSFGGAIDSVKGKFVGVDGAATAAAQNIKNVGLALGTALLAGLAFEAVKSTLDTITTATKGTSEATKGLRADYEEYLRLLKEPIPEPFKQQQKSFKDEFQGRLNAFETVGDAINDTFNKTFNQKEGDLFYGRTNKDVKSEQSSINFDAQLTESNRFADLAARKTEEIQAKIKSGQAVAQKDIDATAKAIQSNISRIQSIEAVGDAQKFAKSAQLNYLEALAAKQQKITEAKLETNKVDKVSDELSKEKLKEAKEEAKRIQSDRNADTEKTIKRSQDDAKSKRDLENANAIKAIEERNAIAKGELDKKQALETEELKDRQSKILQDRQRTFDEIQGAKKLQREEAIDAKKRANELSLQALQQDFDDRQAKQKEERAEKIRQEDEKFANARAERDRKNSEALSGAKSLIANEGEIAKASPEEKAKVTQKIQEEQRIATEAKTQGVAGEQTQEQLVAKAKQLARVQAIATAEEQAKVQLALDELEKANKAKQAEIDKAEDAKRAEAKRVADKEFEVQQQAAKRDFETQQNNEKLAFEQTVLKPEKLKLEKELQADKLAFEQGELAAIKKQQAADERSLRTQQEAEDLALKKAADAELDGIKQAQKQRDIEIDRKFEDEKIARERAFKEEQRNLDKASAAEIQAILGQTSKQLFDAVAAISNSKISAIAGIGAKNNIVPTTGDKGDPLTQIKAGADAIGASTLVTPTATPQASAAKSALQEALRNKIPAFANGGVSKGGLALVGERGREIVNLPKGASVTPANDTRSLLSKGSDNSRVEALLEKLIGSVNRPNLEIKTTDDPVTIATDIYRRTAAQDLKRSGL